MVIADHFQCRNKVTPEIRAVSISHGSEQPGSALLFSIRLGIKSSVQARVCRVDFRVLCVNVKDCRSQGTHSQARINSLPEKMTRVQVAAKVYAHLFTKPKKC